MKPLLALVLIGLIGVATAAYCPLRPDQHCSSKWSSEMDEYPEKFWNMWTCQARGLPSEEGTPCFDSTPMRDAMYGDPAGLQWDEQTLHPDTSQLWTSEKYWTQLKREAQINKPTTENFGKVGHIAAFETGDGRPFIINHGMLNFQSNNPTIPHTGVDNNQNSGQRNFEVKTFNIEELADAARWMVCTSPDCSSTTAPQLFTEEEHLPSYFNWNPCGQTSGVHVWVNGQKTLTFVGVGSRTTWTDARVVLGQCIDAACSGVKIREIGGNLRNLPAVEHQCLGGKFGVGARIIVGSDGNPSIMWRHKENPSDIVYIHCKNTECTDFEKPQYFGLESERMEDIRTPNLSPDRKGVHANQPSLFVPALWWDLVSSPKGIWLVTLHQANMNAFDSETFIQVTKCSDTSCEASGEKYPSPGRAAVPVDTSNSASNEEASAFRGKGWSWAINSYGSTLAPKNDEAFFYRNPIESGVPDGAAFFGISNPVTGDVSFAARTFSAGLTGDGFPMFVGQAENGPQSQVSWIVCSCRTAACEAPECHILADSDSIMDPAMRECVKFEDITMRPNGFQNNLLPESVLSPHGAHFASRHRIINGGSKNLPIIVQHISTFCIEVTGGNPSADPYKLLSAAYNTDTSTPPSTPTNMDESGGVYSFSPTSRNILMQSSKAVYINCLDATCSEASLSALQSPKVASVSLESAYNQVESILVAPDHVITIFSPDQTYNELSYSWTQTLIKAANPGPDDVLFSDVYNTPGVPFYVALREILQISPTPRTAGWKTWYTNRWSSPSGQPCESSQVGRQISADGVVFVCTRLDLGDDQRWGTSAVEGWTRFYEWKELGWGLRWRWQGDVHLGTDRAMPDLADRLDRVVFAQTAPDSP